MDEHWAIERGLYMAGGEDMGVNEQTFERRLQHKSSRR